MPIPIEPLAVLKPVTLPHLDPAITHLAVVERMLWFGLLLVILLPLVLFAVKSACEKGRRAQRRILTEMGLASPDILRVGLEARLELPDGSDIRHLRARVAEVQKQWIILTLPSETRADWPCVGAPMRVTVADGSAAYRFHGGIQDRRITDDSTMIFLPRPEWVEKVQRRQFYRLPVFLSVTVTPLYTPNEPGPACRGIMLNLSGGGACIAIPSALPQGTHVRIRLPEEVPGGSFEALVVRRVEAAPGAHDPTLQYWAHCEFLYLNEETINQIVNYCFETERRRRYRS